MGHKYKKWNLLHKGLSKTANTPEVIVDILLKNRGLSAQKDKIEFFSPTNPENLKVLDSKKMDKAVDGIKSLDKSKERILIYGDYDADGICATAILWEALDALGFDAIPYIPDRFSDGYGLKAKRVLEIAQNENIRLVITVDNGIVANKEVDKLKASNIQTIVIDHHHKGKSLPKAFSVLHSTKVSGAALSWFFSKYLFKKLNGDKESLKFGDGLELAAIGTISDVMPLVKENRSFAFHGLKKLCETTRPGLLELIKQSALRQDQIGCYEVGFVIAPRLNAMGRLEKGIDSLRLLCTRNAQNASTLASKLEKVNSKRQEIVEEVYSHALIKLQDNQDTPLIMLSSEKYHEGVIGLAASRLTEKFYKPSIVIFRGKKTSKASARSVEGYSIIENLKIYEQYFDAVGGHTLAAGFSIKTNMLDEFAQNFLLNAAKDETLKGLTKTLQIDMQIKLSQINDKLVEVLDKFEPTGNGNKRPSFLIKNAQILEAKTVGSDNKHLKLVLGDGQKVLSAIAFGFGDIYQQVIETEKINVVCSPEINEWKGVKSLQLAIRDVSFEN